MSLSMFSSASHDIWLSWPRAEPSACAAEGHAALVHTTVRLDPCLKTSAALVAKSRESDPPLPIVATSS